MRGAGVDGFLTGLPRRIGEDDYENDDVGQSDENAVAGGESEGHGASHVVTQYISTAQFNKRGVFAQAVVDCVRVAKSQWDEQAHFHHNGQGVAKGEGSREYDGVSQVDNAVVSQRPTYGEKSIDSHLEENATLKTTDPVHQKHLYEAFLFADIVSA